MAFMHSSAKGRSHRRARWPTAASEPDKASPRRPLTRHIVRSGPTTLRRGATPRHHDNSPVIFNAMLPLHVEVEAKHELLHHTEELDQEGTPRRWSPAFDQPQVRGAGP